MLMVGAVPSLIAGRALAARNAYTKAFTEYYRKGGIEQASALIKGRKDVLGGAGFSDEDLASFDISIVLAATSNSNPSIMWFLCYIYSDAKYLASLREEILPAIKVSDDQVLFDVSYLLKGCPLLVASWQEMLRTRSVTTSSRIVMEDTLLNDQYLLRKGGVLQLVSARNNASTDIWGSDVADFNPSRFMKQSQENLSRETKKQRRDGYTPFGGGSSLCPGRNFVTMEILSTVATFVMGYDIVNVDGSQIKSPNHKPVDFGVQIRIPDRDPKVVVSRRKGWAGKKWVYDVGDGVDHGSENLVFNAAPAQAH